MTPPTTMGRRIKTSREASAVLPQALTVAAPIRVVSRNAWRPHRLGVNEGNEVLRDFETFAECPGIAHYIWPACVESDLSLEKPHIVYCGAA